jgi:hypothetical protein
MPELRKVLCEPSNTFTEWCAYFVVSESPLLCRRCDELEKIVDGISREGKMLNERVERLRNEKDAVQLTAEERDIQLKNAMDKLAASSEVVSNKDAHVWWSYVWHELRRQEREEERIDRLNRGVSDYIRGSGGVTGDMTEGHSPNSAPNKYGDPLLVQSAKLKNDLAAQGAELANMRQTLLAKDMQSRQEVAQLKEQLESCRRELVRQQAQMRTHRGDKEIKVAINFQLHSVNASSCTEQNRICVDGGNGSYHPQNVID